MKINKTYSLITLSTLIILFSCGKEAEVILAKNELLPISNNNSLTIGDKTVDTDMRAMTLLIYPTVRDLESFIYRPKGDAIVPWETVISSLPGYGNRLTQNYTADMNSEAKLFEMVLAIQSVGESRDLTFRKMAPLSKEIKVQSDIIKDINSKLKKRIKKFKCFYPKKPARGNPYDCRLKSDEIYKKKKKLSSCRKIDTYIFTFLEGEEESEKEHSNILESCLALSKKQIELNQVKKQMTEFKSTRESGESVVLDLLQSAERIQATKGVKKKSFVATGASKEKVDEEEEKSQIYYKEALKQNVNVDLRQGKIQVIDKKTPDYREVSGLKLLIDFGLNYSEGPGYKEYSTRNGKIKNLVNDTYGSAEMIKFEIHTSDFIIHAELSRTIQQHMDLRYIGEIFVTYPDGEKSKGAMKLEFDLVE